MFSRGLYSIPFHCLPCCKVNSSSSKIQRYQGNFGEATKSKSFASFAFSSFSFRYHPPSPEDILRFRHLMQQNNNSNQPANAHLGFSHPHYPHHHLFMRPGIMGPIGDVYSCIKCEKMFSTPHGLEVWTFEEKKLKFLLTKLSMVRCMHEDHTMERDRSPASCATKLSGTKSAWVNTGEVNEL